MQQIGQNVGVVVIGRNQEPYLKQCLQSVVAQTAAVVYVDTGSSDGSVALAQSFPVDVVQLHQSPSTSGHPHQSGWDRLLHLHPDLEYIQFVEANCELLTGWFAQAVQTLANHPSAGMVCGQRWERYCDRPLSNALCDMECHILPQPTKTLKGEALIRRTALGHGIPADVAELGLHLQKQGWQLLPIASPMTLHTTPAPQPHTWWHRLLPIAPATHRSVRSPRKAQYPKTSWQTALLLACFGVLGKVPYLLGQIQFYWEHSLKKPRHLTGYKQ